MGHAKYQLGGASVVHVEGKPSWQTENSSLVPITHDLSPLLPPKQNMKIYPPKNSLPNTKQCIVVYNMEKIYSD